MPSLTDHRPCAQRRRVVTASVLVDRSRHREPSAEKQGGHDKGEQQATHGHEATSHARELQAVPLKISNRDRQTVRPTRR